MNNILNEFPKKIAVFQKGSLTILFDARPDSLSVSIIEKDNLTVAALPAMLYSHIINSSPYKFIIIETVISGKHIYGDIESVYYIRLFFLHLRFINEKELKYKTFAQIADYKKMQAASRFMNMNVRSNLNSYILNQMSNLFCSAPTDLLSMSLNNKIKQNADNLTLDQILAANRCVTENKAVFYFASLPRDCYLELVSDVRSVLLMEIKDILSRFPFFMWFDNIDMILIIKVVKRAEFKEQIDLVLNSINRNLNEHYQVILEKFSPANLLAYQVNYSLEYSLLEELETLIFKAVSDIIENVNLNEQIEAFHQLFRESVLNIACSIDINKNVSVEYLCKNWLALLCTTKNVRGVKSFRNAINKAQKTISNKAEYNQIFAKDEISVARKAAAILVANFSRSVSEFLKENGSEHYIGCYFSQGITQETEGRKTFLLSQFYIFTNKLGDHLALTYSDRITLVQNI